MDSSLNIDEATFSDLGGSGLGGVLLDHTRDVFLSFSKFILSHFDTLTTECLALQRVVWVSLEAGFIDFIVEPDLLTLVNHLWNNDFTLIPCRHIINNTVRLFDFTEISQCLHCHKEGNFVAHHLDRCANLFIGFRVLLEEVLPQVEQFVLSDSTS